MGWLVIISIVFIGRILSACLVIALEVSTCPILIVTRWFLLFPFYLLTRFPMYAEAVDQLLLLSAIRIYFLLFQLFLYSWFPFSWSCIADSLSAVSAKLFYSPLFQLAGVSWAPGWQTGGKYVVSAGTETKAIFLYIKRSRTYLLFDLIAVRNQSAFNYF